MKIKFIIEFEEEITSDDVNTLMGNQLPIVKDYLDERITKVIKQLSNKAQNINLHLDLLEDEN